MSVIGKKDKQQPIIPNLARHDKYCINYGKVNNRIHNLGNSMSPSAMLDNWDSSKLTQMADKRKGRAVAQYLLDKILRFWQWD
jgi:hypothetical protein